MAIRIHGRLISKCFLISALCGLITLIYWIRHEKVQEPVLKGIVPKDGPQYGPTRNSWGRADEVKVTVVDRIAKILKYRIRILCLVLTIPEHAETSALAVFQTWGKRCTQLLFVSTQPMGELPHVVVNATDGFEHLTSKTMAMFTYVANNFADKFDWFLKADDDTYVVMDNLRYLLTFYDKDEPVYLGHHFKRFVNQGYMSGGAGYVISKVALGMFKKKSSICKFDGWGEDVDFGDCMEKIGVPPSGSKDIHGRNSFHAVGILEELTWISYIEEHAQQVKEAIHVGPSCCSQLSVTFHKVSTELMYLLEFLLYRMSIYGRFSPQNLFQPDFFEAMEIPNKHHSPDPKPYFV